MAPNNQDEAIKAQERRSRRTARLSAATEIQRLQESMSETDYQQADSDINAAAGGDEATQTKDVPAVKPGAVAVKSPKREGPRSVTIGNGNATLTPAPLSRYEQKLLNNQDRLRTPESSKELDAKGDSPDMTDSSNTKHGAVSVSSGASSMGGGIKLATGSGDVQAMKQEDPSREKMESYKNAEMSIPTETTTITASLVEDNAPTAEDFDELKKQVSFLRKQTTESTSNSTTQVVMAEKIATISEEGDEEQGKGNAYAASKDAAAETGGMSKKTKILLLLLVLVIVGVGAGIGASMSGGGDSKDDSSPSSSSNNMGEADDDESETPDVIDPPPASTDDEPEPELGFFDLVAPSIDGLEPDLEFGSSLSLSTDGTRMAVADDIQVSIYDLKGGEWVAFAEPIMPANCGEAPRGSTSTVRANVIVDLSGGGGECLL